MKYFKYNELDGFKPGTKITLELPGKNPIKGSISCNYISSPSNSNSIFITEFGINYNDRYKVVNELMGYPCNQGEFPEVHSTKDLELLCQKLEEYYDKQHGIKSSVFNKKKQKIKLNFKV